MAANDGQGRRTPKRDSFWLRHDARYARISRRRTLSIYFTHLMHAPRRESFWLRRNARYARISLRRKLSIYFTRLILAPKRDNFSSIRS